MSENGHNQDKQDLINHDISHHEHKPYWKRIHHTWGFWVFLVLMLGAILYYIVSVDFALAPRSQPKQPVGNHKTS